MLSPLLAAYIAIKGAFLLQKWLLKQNFLSIEEFQKIVWDGVIQLQEISPTSICCRFADYDVTIKGEQLHFELLEHNFVIITVKNLYSIHLTKGNDVESL